MGGEGTVPPDRRTIRVTMHTTYYAAITLMTLMTLMTQIALMTLVMMVMTGNDGNETVMRVMSETFEDPLGGGAESVLREDAISLVHHQVPIATSQQPFMRTIRDAQ